MQSITISRLLEISSQDPEDARRRRLVAIILLGMSIVAFLGLLAMVGAYISGWGAEEDFLRLAPTALVFLFCVIILFLINRSWSGEVASVFFLLILIAVFSFSDEPRQVVEGRALFLFTIPILMSSVILRPWASFIVAGLCGLVISIITASLPLDVPFVPPIPTILGFFTIALVSWLSARSLENALADLRALNLQLEDRVRERTRELAETNAELEEANERLKELDRLKSRFVSMVSHELRTPLSAILGFAEMMEAGVYGAITEGQQGALDRIKANDQRLLNLVNDLLDQARMEAGQLALHIAPFSIHDLVTDMESTMRVIAESKGLQLTTDVEADVPETLMGDVKRLHQILVNLINNSLKFTNEGGVHVRFYCPDAEYWAMDIVDTGPGIPDDAIDYIFEAFRQVDDSATRQHKGFGLGLSIVKQLAELMGGGVRVTSELGKGSTFTVFLPFEPPQQG